MDEQTFTDDKSVDRTVRNFQRWGMQDTLSSYITHDGDTVTYVYSDGIITRNGSMTAQFYQKVIDRIALRKQITADERESLKMLASILLDSFGYLNLMNKLLIIPKESATVILNNKDQITSIPISPNILIDIVNECQHHKDAVHYHSTGYVTTPFTPPVISTSD